MENAAKFLSTSLPFLVILFLLKPDLKLDIYPVISFSSLICSKNGADVTEPWFHFHHVIEYQNHMFDRHDD